MVNFADTEIERLADLLDAARQARVCVHPFSQRLGLGETDAYHIQKAGLSRRRERGERAIGFKLGFTSAAMRKQLGVQSANFGVLTDAMRLDAEKGLNSARLIHPRAEPEVALKLALDLRYPVERGRAESAIAACALAVEIVDSRFYDYRFTLEDNIADNSSAAAFFLGAWRDMPFNLDCLNARLMINGEVAEEGDTGAAMGGPLDALIEASRLANAWGYTLTAGDIILTGGLTAAPYIRTGQVIGARIAELGEVVFSVY